MNDATKAPGRIWAWSEDCGDVCVNEWVPDDPDCLGSYAEEAQTYILATPAALAASPEVAKMIEQASLAEKMRMVAWCAKRQAVSRKAWERASRKALAGDMSELRNRIAMIDAGPLDIVQSAEAAALRGEKEPKP